MALVQDMLVVYADGRMEMQNLGANYSRTFFTFEIDPMGGRDIKVPVLKLIMPKSALVAGGPLSMEVARLPDPTRRERLDA